MEYPACEGTDIRSARASQVDVLLYFYDLKNINKLGKFEMISRMHILYYFDSCFQWGGLF